ncbi:hypothetical protein ACLX1H_000051 [Fusarium chlamydosporum]
MSTSITKLLLVPNDGMTLMGKVLGADATATTYVLECPFGAEDCDRFTETLTLGPWAEKTLAPGAAKTGDFDIWISDTLTDGTPWTVSQHCKMSRSVAQECTISQGPVKDSKDHKTKDYPPQTYTDKQELAEVYGPTYQYAEVTLTAGLEKLASTTATGSDTATSAEHTESSTSGAAAPEETNSAGTGV